MLEISSKLGLDFAELVIDNDSNDIRHDLNTSSRLVYFSAAFLVDTQLHCKGKFDED